MSGSNLRERWRLGWSRDIGCRGGGTRLEFFRGGFDSVCCGELWEREACA